VVAGRERLVARVGRAKQSIPLFTAFHRLAEGGIVVARKRFTPAEVGSILREYQSGEKVPVLCRRHGVSEQTLYLWLVRWRRLEATPLAG